VDPEYFIQAVRTERPEHQQLTVRDIDDLHHAEDDVESERDERPDRANDEPADEYLEDNSRRNG
jgi:hypothetical protein